MWAEWYWHLAEQAIQPLAQMLRDLWTWEADVEAADLSTAERLDASVCLHHDRDNEPGPPFSGSASACGRTAGRDCSHRALPPPPQRKVLCLFRGCEWRSGARPLGKPRRISEPPPPSIGL